VAGTTLTVYASQPPGAASGAVTDTLDAERLALKQTGSTVGRYTVQLIPVHQNELSANARTAVENKSTIAYLGELEPGTSQTSVQITNELDILEVSPLDTAVYLTQSTPAVANAPGVYYPSGSSYHQTFARVVPTTAQEAKAQVAQMKTLGASRLYVAGDGSAYGASIGLEVHQDAASAGLSIVSSPSAADAIFYGSNDPAAATTVLDRFADEAPGAKLFVPSGLYDNAFVGGLSPTAQRNLYVSSPGFTARTLSAAGQQFQTAFTSQYGHMPAPQAIFGYEAMAAVLAVLKEAGTAANNRSTVVHDFRAITNRQSVLGTYSLSNGDPSIAPFFFATVRNGALQPLK
jgi:ABC-type branched-subunit amino acid transport system substrate-binding protein